MPVDNRSAVSVVRATLVPMRDTPVEMSPPLPGYELRERLGAGRRGEVWWAVELATRDDVALRWLAQPADVDDRGRLVAAAEALTALSHPHLVRVRAVISAPSHLVLVSDFARGGSLGDLVDRRGTLEPGEAVTVLAPLAQALTALHAQGASAGGIGERDVLLTENGRPLLGDVCLDTLLVDENAGGTPSSGPADDVRALAALAERMLRPLSDAPLSDAAASDAAAIETGGAEVGVPSEDSAPRRAVLAVTRPALDPRPECRPSAAALADALLAACPPVPLRGITRRQLQSRGPAIDGPPMPPKLARREPALPVPPDRPSEESPTPRRVLVGVAAVALLGAAVVTGVSWAGHGSPPAAAPLPSLPAAASPPSRVAAPPRADARATPGAAATPRADPPPSSDRVSAPPPSSDPVSAPPLSSDRVSAPPRWAQLLRQLDATRAQAFARGDRAALRTVYADQSPAYRRDAKGLRRLSRAGLHVRGLRLTDIRVTDARRRSNEVVLRVSDRLAAYDVVTSSGDVRRHEAGRGRTAWRVTLARADPTAEWRIRDVQRASRDP
jgi:hypothetical protein